MNVLAVGDVVGTQGCEFLRKHLPLIKKLKGIDMVIANGENSAPGNGISISSAQHLFDSGVDVITTGNHVFRKTEIYEYLDGKSPIVRPANLHREAPGKGFCVIDKLSYQVCVINLLGTVFMDNPFNAFDCVDSIIKDFSNTIIIVDFHAEATSEKRALSYYLDGKVSVVFGTHTHVQTADEQILPKGTGYITDLGMTGPTHSVLGVDCQSAINKIRTRLPSRFEISNNPCCISGCIFSIDEKCLNTVFVERICII